MVYLFSFKTEKREKKPFAYTVTSSKTANHIYLITTTNRLINSNNAGYGMQCNVETNNEFISLQRQEREREREEKKMRETFRTG